MLLSELPVKKNQIGSFYMSFFIIFISIISLNFVYNNNITIITILLVILLLILLN